MGPAWMTPADTWVEAIERYVAFIQVPAWRARAPGTDGTEPRECLPAAEAARLKASMRRVAKLLASRRGLRPSRCRPERSDLDELLKHCGRGVGKEERCSLPRRLHWHFQRALLLNKAGYACRYCGRSGWPFVREGPSEHRSSEHRLDDSRQGADVRVRLQRDGPHGALHQEPRPNARPTRRCP